MSKSVEIVCSACGADTLVRREARYEGFKKVGDRFLCASCGHEFPSEDAVPFKVRPRLNVFTEGDRPRQVDIFKSDEKGRNCRHRSKRFRTSPPCSAATVDRTQ